MLQGEFLASGNWNTVFFLLWNCSSNYQLILKLELDTILAMKYWKHRINGNITFHNLKLCCSSLMQLKIAFAFLATISFCWLIFSFRFLLSSAVLAPLIFSIFFKKSVSLPAVLVISLSLNLINLHPNWNISSYCSSALNFSSTTSCLEHWKL